MLAGSPATAVAPLVARMLAMQAQDLGAARLAVRARSEGLVAADVDRALSDERSLVVKWLLRGTLHLVCADDLPWLHALCAPALATANRRRLGQEGVSPDAADRAVALVDRALADEGPLTRVELKQRLDAAGIRTEGQALIHLLFHVGLQGVAVRGPLRGKQHAYVRTRDWLGASKPVDRAAALAELARRYLQAFGPATDADLAFWSGLALRDARSGLSAIARELTEHGAGLVDLAGRAPAPRRVPPRLVPLWDNYLLGWKDRSFQVGAEHAGRVFVGGMIGLAALREGRVVGRWARRRDRSVALEPFGANARGFAAQSRDVERFMRSA